MADCKVKVGVALADCLQRSIHGDTFGEGNCLPFGAWLKGKWGQQSILKRLSHCAVHVINAECWMLHLLVQAMHGNVCLHCQQAVCVRAYMQGRVRVHLACNDLCSMCSRAKYSFRQISHRHTFAFQRSVTGPKKAQSWAIVFPAEQAGHRQRNVVQHKLTYWCVHRAKISLSAALPKACICLSTKSDWSLIREIKIAQLQTCSGNLSAGWGDSSGHSCANGLSSRLGYRLCISTALHLHHTRPQLSKMRFQCMALSVILGLVKSVPLVTRA